ncbi:sugar phosphate isomerase/epimerase family protein [Cellvibrio sp. NN19]|uniref:sugar phosphate isomerase/epimerase family protein n=1 Tax=Cellvibrio chitinivorans TaxID=3102792 RepID=UPI002B40DF75|nr:sugar phosphate isomerase/epimerase family protein [Cellvibrio sp. NN19]
MKPFFGLRAHDFGTFPPEELAMRIASSGAQVVQLALAKAFPGGHLMPEEFGADGIAEIRAAFAAQGISVGVIGCYIDTVTPDLAAREFSFKRFEAHIDVAADLGCAVIGTETGSPVAYLDQPNGRETAFRVALNGLYPLVKAAEKKGVRVGVEAVAEYHALSTIEHIRTMITEFDSPALGIIFDPVNLIPLPGVENMDVFLDECFATFGDRIVAIHAKDYKMVESDKGLMKLGDLPVGTTGVMDWAGVFKRLMQAGKTSVPILLEDTSPAHAVDSFAYLQCAWDEALTQLN